MTFKELTDAVSTLGVVGFALAAVYAFVWEKVFPKGAVDRLLAMLEIERAEKKEAVQLAREAIAANSAMADAVEERNRLEAAREMAEREAVARPPVRRRR